MITNINKDFDVPVLLIIFNRPEVTRQVFEAIRQARPQKLFIAADGYRQDKVGEKELCELTKTVVSNVDWPCEVHHDYLDHNIGPCARVPLAINWFFDGVERGIIFEDDCLPDATFFPFCRELLERYKNNEKIMNISGSNFQDGKIRGEASYYFSIYPTTWGWATWKRAWKLYDKNMNGFPNFLKENRIQNIVPNAAKKEQRYWLGFFKKEYDKKFVFWDVKWLFALWTYERLSVIPNNNLVTNIGFGNDATHTKGNLELSIPSQVLLEIVHTPTIVVNEEADRYHYKKLYSTNLLKKIIYKVRMIFG